MPTIGMGRIFAQEVDGGGRSGIAGHDNQLAPCATRKATASSARRRTSSRGATRRAVLTVTQVDERLSGERTPHLAPDGQPAQPESKTPMGALFESLSTSFRSCSISSFAAQPRRIVRCGFRYPGTPGPQPQGLFYFRPSCLRICSTTWSSDIASQSTTRCACA